MTTLFTSAPYKQVPVTAPVLLLADLDNDADFEPLDALFDEARRGKLWGICYGIEFQDDNHKRGYRALEFNCEIKTGANESDTFLLSVKVSAKTPITEIATDLVAEILAQYADAKEAANDRYPN